MDDRELRWYEAEHHAHPPLCNCRGCTAQRLRLAEAQKWHGSIVCPICHYQSVNYWERDKAYICANPQCQARGATLLELGSQTPKLLQE